MRMINESKEKKKNPEKTPRSASAVMRRRAAVSMTVLVVMGAAVAGKLFKVSIVDNSKYETLANNYHFGTMTLDANRGAIYDANGTALAWSATVYNIYVDPKLYRDEIKEIEKSNDKKKSAAEEKGEQAANLVDVTQLEQSSSLSSRKSWRSTHPRCRRRLPRTADTASCKPRWKRTRQTRSPHILIS